MTNNPQDVLINSTEGIYLVDAGAGTGKTYSIVKRYGKLLDSKVSPDDILLVTFTENAAQQMKDEVIFNLSGKASLSKLLEAPIMTFHSFCSKILKTAGYDAPDYIGINETIGKNFRILEDKTLEYDLFRKHFSAFGKKYFKKHGRILQSVEGKHEEVLNVIKKLNSAGIFPGKKGWSKLDYEKLKGDYELFSDVFDIKNLPLKGEKGDRQSILLTDFKSIVSSKIFKDYDANSLSLEKIVNPEIKKDIFYDPIQDELIEFLCDVYITYIEYLLERNLLNFEFMVMFAYLVILNNHSLRNKISFDYVMIDEFQDTDEIQFKIIMLLCKNIRGKANLCVVGDWKQGIYGFRNTTIKNITEFSENLNLFKKELNENGNIINYDTDSHEKIILENNYRSSDEILKFSRETLFVKGTQSEEPDKDYINVNFKHALKPQRDPGKHTEIRFYTADDKLSEYTLILKKISELVNEKNKYRISVFGKEGNVISDRPVTYSDICVLSRKKSFCLEFLREAIKQGIPVNYSGGMEIFLSEPGILVLAWFRLMINDRDFNGWIPVLDKEGFSYPEAVNFKKILDKNSDESLFSPAAPDESTLNFLKHLRKLQENITQAAGAVLTRYCFNDAVSNKIISVIKGWLDEELISLTEIVRLIENSEDTEFSIDVGNSSDAVLTQSIHQAKGMEYPVVFVSNINDRVFPSQKGESNIITYFPGAGLRLKSYFDTNGKYYYRYDNPNAYFTNSVFKKSDYDEERRLLYVSVTRAKQYLYFTSYRPSLFFKILSGKYPVYASEKSDYPIIAKSNDEKTDTKFVFPGIKTFDRTNVKSVHEIMETDKPGADGSKFSDKIISSSVKDSIDKGRLIHGIACKLANGIEVESDLPEVNKISEFLKNLNAGKLMPEVDFLYPKKRNIIRGTIDLLAFFNDRIEIYDYKTDTNKKFIEQYKIQMSVYKEAIKSIYKDISVKGYIYFINADEIIEA